MRSQETFSQHTRQIYLFIRTLRRAGDTAIDNDMLYCMQEVQKLPDSENDKINSIIDAFVRDTKVKQAFRIF
ncbi:hypothetical protein [Flavobacterium sp. 5]|uniref:hypothetical protein n=1 Tax=Flavobacterium sp. 5 TaxID=2035199 RepID=UPI0012FD8C53|nr:hypothetical protein [Flavobacterium sp. 5]